MLISGYYLVNSKGRSIASIAKIWLEVFFYSFVITLAFYVLKKSDVGIKDVFLSCIPITGITWNYASAYFVLMLFTPYINALLKHLSKRQYKSMLMLAFICWCIIPTITGRDFESNYLIWMIVMYSVGAYINLYPSKYFENRKLAIWITMISYFIYLVSVIVMDALGMRIGFFANEARAIRFGQMQMLPCVAMAISLFLVFKNTKIKYNKTINTVASAVFGVYLIHEHPFIRTILWEDVFKNADYAYCAPVQLVLYTVFAVACVFAVCSLIELLRINSLEKLYMKPVSKVCKKIESKIIHEKQGI